MAIRLARRLVEIAKADVGSVADSARRAATSPVRAYVRYFPLRRGKWWVYWNVADRFLLWEPRRCVTRTVFGARVHGDTTDIVHRYLYWFGIWEPQLTHFLLRRLTPGDTFVDVGANVGYFSLLASRLVGAAGRVVAIEPSPAVHRQLVANLRRNRWATNVRALNVAASDRSGTAAIYAGPEWHEGLASIHPDPEAGLRLVGEVETLSVSDLLSERELATARVVKIDVEGAEAMVVRGLTRLRDQGRDDLEVVVELDPARLSRHGESAEQVVETFAAAGFVAYRLENVYRVGAYLDPDPLPIRRLDSPPSTETDVVFSRIVADRL